MELFYFLMIEIYYIIIIIICITIKYPVLRTLDKINVFHTKSIQDVKDKLTGTKIEGPNENHDTIYLTPMAFKGFKSLL